MPPGAAPGPYRLVPPPTIQWPPSQDMLYDPVSAHGLVIESGQFNYQSQVITVPTSLNIDAWRDLATKTDLKDPELINQLEFGFPVPFDEQMAGGLPQVPTRNHPSSYAYFEHVDKYIATEISLSALSTGYQVNPLASPLTVSPIQTVPKKGTDQRRTVIDLSFGTPSVNDGLAADKFPDYDHKLTYPSIDKLAAKIRAIGPKALLFKVDLSRFYRQLPTCPSSYSHTAIVWRSMIHLDLRLAFGCRTSASCAQRVSNAIAKFYEAENPTTSVDPFLDDFGNAAHPTEAMQLCVALLSLLSRLGVDVAELKTVFPTSVMEYLGLLFDASEMEIRIPPEKLNNAMAELKKWLKKSSCTKRQLQSLLGKLYHLSCCLPSARIFMSRLLNLLRQGNFPATIDLETKRDILWWNHFLPSFQGVSLILDNHWTDNLISSDATPFAMGCALTNDNCNMFCSQPFPQDILDLCLPIHCLEALALIVALKVFSGHLARKRFLFHCDNTVVVKAINDRKSRVPFIQAALRELWILQCNFHFQVKAVYISSQDNVISDLASRLPFDPSAHRKFHKLTSQMLPCFQKVSVPEEMFKFNCPF